MPLLASSTCVPRWRAWYLAAASHHASRSAGPTQVAPHRWGPGHKALAAKPKASPFRAAGVSCRSVPPATECSLAGWGAVLTWCASGACTLMPNRTSDQAVMHQGRPLIWWAGGG